MLAAIRFGVGKNYLRKICLRIPALLKHHSSQGYWGKAVRTIAGHAREGVEAHARVSATKPAVVAINTSVC